MSIFSRAYCAAFLILAGCASGDYEPWLTKGVNAPTPEVRDTFSLERTECYGFCPVYTVTVDDRDILEFQGKRFVAEEGGAVGKRLPPGTYTQLLAIADAHDFDRFDTSYPDSDGSNCAQVATDMPSVIVGFSKNRKKQTVRVYEGCMGFDGRDRFNAMVAAIDAVLDINDLVGPREDFYNAEE